MARQLKEKWQEEIRDYLPDTAADISSFKEIVQDMRHGGGSYTRTDLIVAIDKVVERVEGVYERIREPKARTIEHYADDLLNTTLDTVKAEAIGKVSTDPEYQRDNPLIHSIFRGIQKVNDQVHASNPFTAKLSSTALDQIEAHVQKIQAELSLLETNLGSFHAPHGRYADQPIRNPFKSAGTKPGSLGQQTGNPFLSTSAKRLPANETNPEPVASVDFDSHNPFIKKNNPVSNGSASLPKSKSAQTAKKNQIAADDPDSAPCSAEVSGPTTDECKQRRHGHSSKKAAKAR